MSAAAIVAPGGSAGSRPRDFLAELHALADFEGGHFFQVLIACVEPDGISGVGRRMLNDDADAADAVRRFFLFRYDRAVGNRQNRRAIGSWDIQAGVHAVVEARV